MSISTLADRKVELLKAEAGTETPPATDPSSDNTATAKTISDALSAVAAYVPTEIIAIYTLVIATAIDPSITGDKETPLSIGAFLGFLGATPFFVWLVFVVKKIASDHDKHILKSWRSWPWWEAISATIAFTAWSAMMPHSAFRAWLSQNIAAIVLVVVSGLLPLLGGLFANVKT